MSIGKRPTQYEGVLPKNPPNVIFTDRNPVNGTDKAFNPGDLWLNSDELTVWQFAKKAGAIWIALGTGATGGVVTINSLSPTAGNIIIAGTANQITATSSGSTVTLSIPAVFIAPGSIASTTTITAGTSLVATTAVVAGTTVTATLGNIAAVNGNFVKGTAGNKDVYTSVATNATAGANSAGTVTLIGGTATVATTAVTANSLIRLYRQSVGATGAAATGNISRGTITPATSFVINSVDAADATALATTDVSVVFWEIVN